MANYRPKQFAQHLRSLAKSFVSDMNDALMDSAIEAQNHFDESFENEGFNDGGHVEPWEPLSKRRISEKGHDRILKDTGRLKRARKRRILPPSNGDRIARISYHRQYAALMNYGGLNEEDRHVPARKFIGRSRVLNRRIKGILTTRINRLFNKNFSIGRR